MIKMIVTDLDGTLLRDDKSVSDFTKRTLARCQEAGIKTVLATGRGASAWRIVPGELFDAHILMNGANAWVGGIDLCGKFIALSVMRPLLRRLSAMHIRVSVQIDGMHYVNFHPDTRWPMSHYVLSDFADLPGDASVIDVTVDSLEQARLIEAALPEELYFHVLRDNFGMIMHRDATKWKAVETLAAHWGIGVRDVAAFGDDVNDIDMLIHCGLGVAVANALEEVKDIADEICASNEDDGVARWIDQKIGERERR